MNNYNTVVNGWQALVIMGPGILAFAASCVASYVSLKNKGLLDKNAKITNETREKVNNVNINQKSMHDLINSRQTELIDIVKKSSFAEGVIEGLKRDQTFTVDSIFDGLKNKELITIEKEKQVKMVIKEAIITKDKLINEALIAKLKLDQDINDIKNKLIYELNENLINER